MAKLEKYRCFEHNVYIWKDFTAECHEAHACLHSVCLVPHLAKNGVVNVTLGDFSTTMLLARNTYLLFIGHGHLFGTLPKCTDVIILNVIAATSAPEIIILEYN